MRTFSVSDAVVISLPILTPSLLLSRQNSFLPRSDPATFHAPASSAPTEGMSHAAHRLQKTQTRIAAIVLAPSAGCALHRPKKSIVLAPKRAPAWLPSPSRPRCLVPACPRPLIQIAHRRVAVGQNQALPLVPGPVH